MPRATTSRGKLQVISNCYIEIGTRYGPIRVPIRILPELSDSKAANYTNEPIIGRASPIPTYGYSEPRAITTEITFLVMEEDDILNNLYYLRAIQSCVYPEEPAAFTDDQVYPPYGPPTVARIKCGKLFSGVLDDPDEEEGICCILKSYSVKYDTTVPWDAVTLLPYKFTISCQWEVVYDCSNLPCNNRIIISGR